MTRILAVLAAVVLTVPLLWVSPVSATGNWAVTYPDPVPSRFAAGVPYTLGYWVLQHGTHPYEGDLGPTGLRLTGQGGKVLEFPGTALPEPGHYAAPVAVPAGTWKVEGVQGRFEPYVVGTLRVPGALAIEPLPAALTEEIAQGEQRYWDVIRPPGFPEGTAPLVPPSTPAVIPDASEQAAPAPVPSRQAPAGPVSSDAGPAEEGGGPPAYALLMAAAGGALLAVAALRLPGLARRPRRGHA